MTVSACLPLGRNSTSSALAEADPFQPPFELRTGDKAGQDVVDLIGGYLFCGLDPFCIDP